MLRLLLFFMAGIWIGSTSIWNSELLFWGLLILLITGTLIRKKYISGIWIMGVYLIAGIWLTCTIQPSHQPTHYTKYLNTFETCYAEVISSKKTKKGNRYEIALLRNSKQDRISGYMMIYMADTSHLAPGKYISFRYRGQTPKAPLLPAGFNFATWLKIKNIERIQYITFKDQFHEYPIYDPFRTYIYTFQQRIKILFRQYIGANEESGVASALIFGIKDELDEDIIANYAATGTLHVLAVSGLHVGLMFLLMQIFTKPIKSRYWRLCLQIAALWMYVLICGAEAAVLRAGIMFSVIAWGRSLKKRTGIYNNLGISGCIILFIDPNEIYNAGFLLSYAAVAGIAFLHPVLCNFFEFKNTMIQKGAEFAMVSVAAQIATLPITLIYFHQFPVYFFISNLFIIPLTTIITYGGLLLILISPFAYPACLLGKGLYYLIAFCDAVNAQISRWPQAIIHPIYGTTWEVIAFSASLIFLVWAIGYRHSRSLLFSGLMLSVFLIMNTYRYWSISRQHESIYIHSSREKIYMYIRGHAAKIYIQFSGKSNQYTRKNVADYLLEKGITSISIEEKSVNNISKKPQSERVPE